MHVFRSSISISLDLIGEGAMTGTKILWGQMTLSLTAVLAGVWGATEWTAMRLGFQPAIGPAWFFAAGVPVYEPYLFFAWWYHFDAYAPGIFLEGAAWATGGSVMAVVVAIAGSVCRARQSALVTTYGSARWATEPEVRKAGLLRPAGIYLGRLGKQHLRHAGPEHVLCFAPTRSGKGVGLVLPTLLSWPSSVVVNDIKGENWALTAGWRRDQLGSVCLKFHPTAADGSSARYNPLLEVRSWPNDVRDAQLIADMLIDPDGQGSRDHWDLTAHDLLVGTILHVLYAERQKNLHGCLTLLADPTRTIESTLTTMLKTVHDPERQYGWVDGVGHPTRTHPAVSGAARALLNKSDNERSSVVSSAVKFLNLYRDPVVARNTATSDFAVRDVMHHDRRVSLYLTIPPSDIYRTRPLLRLLLQQIVSRLTETMDFAEGGGGHRHRNPVLLMLDEFPTLGRMDVLQTALAYLPGYGIRAYLIVQDLTQLAHAYGRYEAIISNCHVRVAFAANKVETAKLISDMVGTMTVHKETRTYTGSRLNPMLMHVMASEQETSRPLLTPDEVMRLPDDSALVFVAGHPAIYARKIRYYQDPEFRTRSALPAPKESDRLEHDWSHWTSRAIPRVLPAVPPEEAQTSLIPEDEPDGVEETEVIRPR